MRAKFAAWQGYQLPRDHDRQIPATRSRPHLPEVAGEMRCAPEFRDDVAVILSFKRIEPNGPPVILDQHHSAEPRRRDESGYGALDRPPSGDRPGNREIGADIDHEVALIESLLDRPRRPRAIW
jgi:hypothetical protein